MKQRLQHLIESLREELKEYGEMLALLDQQQEMVMHPRPQALPQCATSINTQAETIAAARREREQHQRHVALMLDLPENSNFADMGPRMSAEYRPLIAALVWENN